MTYYVLTTGVPHEEDSAVVGIYTTYNLAEEESKRIKEQYCNWTEITEIITLNTPTKYFVDDAKDRRIMQLEEIVKEYSEDNEQTRQLYKIYYNKCRDLENEKKILEKAILKGYEKDSKNAKIVHITQETIDKLHKNINEEEL